MGAMSRLLAYAWSCPTTLLGIAAGLASLSVPRATNGILLFTSGRGFAWWFLTRRGYTAITLGHVVLVTPKAATDVLAHEMIHVRQGERWGPLFVPAYLLAMLALRLRGRHPYWDNPFEAEAREKSSSRRV